MPPSDPARLTDREIRELLADLDTTRLMAECGIRAMTVTKAFGVTPSMIGSWKAGRSTPRSPAARLGWLRFNLGMARHLALSRPDGPDAEYA
jgi:hypothetical protein